MGIGILALTACRSTPSAKRVALDVIETMDVSDTQKQCLRDKVEGYDDSTLEAIGNAEENLALDFTDQDVLDNATPELQDFVQDLRTCTAEGG